MLGSLFGSKGDGGAGALRAGNKQARQVWEDQLIRSEKTTAPWYDAGSNAIGELSTLLGLSNEGAEGYGSLTKSFGLDDFEADPGYNFRVQEGNKSLERALAAKGKFFSPEAVNSLGAYNQNMASEEFQNAYARDADTKQRLYNMLFGVSNSGQRAGETRVNTGNIYASNMSDLALQLGTINASEQQRKEANSAGRWNALGQLGGNLLSYGSSPSQSLYGYQLWGDSGGGGNAASTVQTAATLGSLFSDRRLKENITKVGEVDGVNVYRFKYKDVPGVYEGVMADEIAERHPEAVSLDSTGYYKVNYDNLPVDFKIVE